MQPCEGFPPGGSAQRFAMIALQLGFWEVISTILCR
jgi:hypothetical protein